MNVLCKLNWQLYTSCSENLQLIHSYLKITESIQGLFVVLSAITATQMTQYSLFRKSIVHSYLLEHGRKQLGSICCFVSQNRSPNNFIYIEELFIELIFAYCKSSVGVLQKNNMSMEIQNFLCNPPLKLPSLT